MPRSKPQFASIGDVRLKRAEIEGLAALPVDVRGAERAEATPHRSRDESSPAGQGRDHSALVAPPLSTERIVVVSPHLDDGVLSLGASMAKWARRGTRVELLTVLACDPESEAPAGGWDARGGFASEGDAARGRRSEDARASALLGVAPTWFSFGSVDYERHASDDEVLESVLGVIGADSLVLLPGFPLSHPDHRWLVDLVQPALGPPRVGLYAEQPYTMRAPETHEPRFEPIRVSASARIAKWRAMRAYRSQLPLLALEGVSRGPHRLALASELVAWPTIRSAR